MLRITLYKHCILNETYANVFSMGKINNETILEKYLETLDSKTFAIDKVYQENSGQFVFDYEITDITDIYDYNYMKVETIEESEDVEIVKILRYCFVKEIQLKNELVYLNYEEDMWHSYIGKIAGINESFVDASRLIDYENGFNLKVRSLPFEYNGNNYLSITDMFRRQSKTYYAIIEIQNYTTASEGNPSQRFSNYYLFGIAAAGKLFADDYNVLINKIFLMEMRKSILSFGKYDGTIGNDKNYELGNIYIIPKEFNPNLLGFQDTTFAFDFGIFNGTSLEYGLKLLNSRTDNKTLEQWNISNNFKNISLGTFSSQFDIINNGTSFNVKLVGNCSQANFSLTLWLNNKIYDITSDFALDIPISGINSEELSQLRVARELKINNLKQDRIIQGAKTEKAVASDVYSGIESASKIGSGKNASQRIKNSITGTAGIAKATTDLAADITIGTAVQNKLKNEIDATNQPIYSSVKGVFNISSNVLNHLYGLILLSINSDNDDFVKKSINNMGYIAYEYLNDISKLRINDAEYFRTKNINYNVISFKSVSCYGSFARNTAKILNSILVSGVKIWYNENLQEDNYQVG